MNNWTKLRPTFLLWTVYLVLAVLLTWPTARHLTTHLPGDGGDDPAIAWNLWWVKYALLNEGQNPFQTDFMFYPIGINLAFYTLTLLNAATALPLTLIFGPVAASNLHMFFTFAAGAYGTFLLVKYILTTTGSDLGRPATQPRLWLCAAIAGGFYAFASSKLFYVALGQFNIASTHWIPFAALYILRTHRHPHTLKNPLLAGLFLTLQAWAEMTYASFLLIFLALYWVYWLLVEIARSPRQWQIVFSYSKAIAVTGLTFALGILPILANMLPEMLAEGDFLVEGGGFASVFSADLFGFLIPTMHHPLLGSLITQTNIDNFSKGQHIYLGAVLLGLLIVALPLGRARPQLRFWIVAAAIFALLALGPTITLNGHATGPTGPFTLLQTLPFFKGNRYPSRYSVMLILSLTVVAAFVLAYITQRVQSSKRYLWLTAIAALFLFEHLSLPLPQSDMRVPAPYQLIAADPGHFTVLDIPFAWRNGFRITGAPTTQFMFGQFYQTAHQKRLLQGNTSRNPAFKFQYFTRAPVINPLLALETGKSLPPERRQSDRAIAADVLHFFNIKYIVIRSGESDNPGVTPQATQPYIETLFPVDKIHNDPTLKIYRVRATNSQSNILIQSDSPLAPLYFGRGWGLLSPGQPITAQRRQVQLLLPLTGSAQRLTLRLRLPDFAQTETQSVSLMWDDWQSPPQQITKTWQEISIDLPAQTGRVGPAQIWLNFESVTPLSPLQPPAPATDVTVLSAGKAVGDFGHIFINGYDVSPNQRGYNVALIRPDAPPETGYFDTHLDPAASAALSRFLKTASPNSTIALAAADEASNNLGEEAVRAIQQITGANGDLRGCFRCSHALIHAAQTTVEAVEPLGPAGVTTNLGLTEPNVAALLDWLRVEPLDQQK